jgi:short-subunit dehydrogenase
MTDQRPLALVTGASRGIGLELALLFGADGYDVIIVADSGALTAAADKVSGTGASVQSVIADLRTEEGVRKAYEAVTADGRPLAAAALNAGIGQGHSFVETPLEQSFSVIDLNVRGTVHLAKLVLDDMTARNAGRVLITSSSAATMPGSYQAVYNASKSFVQSFAEALQDELRDSDVTITSLMPGPVDTNFFRRADMLDTVIGRGPKDDPADVARLGYEAMQKGDRRVVAASLLSKALVAVNTVTPDVVKAAAHRVLAIPRSN